MHSTSSGNPVKHGKPPYNVALIHGGPGAAGEMAPVAEKLSDKRGILEPLQTADTIHRQVGELISLLQKHADVPVTLAGYSWGAWLAWITASENILPVKKLILISSGPFTQEYADRIMETRLSRLNDAQKQEFSAIMTNLQSGTSENEESAFKRIISLLDKADQFEPAPANKEKPEVDFNKDIFENVWSQANEIRKSGQLINLAEKIKCPVVAIHGTCDPHPVDGVRIPLPERLDDFRFIEIGKCGHKPWREKYARNQFYHILEKELS